MAELAEMQKSAEARRASVAKAAACGHDRPREPDQLPSSASSGASHSHTREVSQVPCSFPSTSERPAKIQKVAQPSAAPRSLVRAEVFPKQGLHQR